MNWRAIRQEIRSRATTAGTREFETSLARNNCRCSSTHGHGASAQYGRNRLSEARHILLPSTKSVPTMLATGTKIPKRT